MLHLKQNKSISLLLLRFAMQCFMQYCFGNKYFLRKDNLYPGNFPIQLMEKTRLCSSMMRDACSSTADFLPELLPTFSRRNTTQHFVRNTRFIYLVNRRTVMIVDCSTCLCTLMLLRAGALKLKFQLKCKERTKK